jgi:autotransporter-associated beta strand protein
MTNYFSRLAIIAGLFFSCSSAAVANSAQWNNAPATGDWNTATNWTPVTVPNGPADTATFATSNQTSISVSAGIEVSRMTFNAGANSFTITVNPNSPVTISGLGIINNSGVTQNFITTPTASGAITFTNSAAAGNSAIYTNQGSATSIAGHVRLADTSSAGNATFINEGGSNGSGYGGYTVFETAASGGNAVLINRTGPGIGFGSTVFHNASSAGNATLTNEGGAGGSGGGTLGFYDMSSAGNATITDNAGTNSGDSGSSTAFLQNATAGSASLIANGAAVSGANGSRIQFFNSATAATATLTANNGVGPGFHDVPQGRIIFSADSSGGFARIKLFGNGELSFNQYNPPGLTVGSIEGDGNVLLGPTNLVVGSNNLSTTFAGIIYSSAGGLQKIGTGTLTLSGANNYFGTTSVAAGTLNLSNSLAAQRSIVATGGAGLVFDASVASHAFTFAGLTSANDLVLQDNAAAPNPVALTITNNNDAGTYSGKLEGTGGLIKDGVGTFTLAGANTYSGPTTVNGGCLIVTGSLGNTAVTINSGACLTVSGTLNGSVEVGNGGTLSGTGTLNGPLTVDSGGVVDLTGGTLTVNNTITNNGLFILSNGSQLAGVTSFINNGTLDIITAGTFVPPQNFVNNGVILDSSVVKVKSAVKTAATITVRIDSYTGHTYRLQKGASPAGASFNNIGSPQQGSTGNVLTFTDSNATGGAAFYRVRVNP